MGRMRLFYRHARKGEVMTIEDFLQLSEEIKRLQKIVDLIWEETGGYGGRLELTGKANTELRKYFNFDDGE